MRIAVGSQNPVKIAAVRAVVTKIWPAAEACGVAVPSGVSAMPMNDAECIAGARGRATAALNALNADLGLGLEGGVHPIDGLSQSQSFSPCAPCLRGKQADFDPIDGQLFLTGWVMAVDRTGRESVGSAARMPLPPAVSAQVLSGRELGPLMDELTGRERTNHAEGAIGILTRQLMTRQRSFEAAVAYALVPWLNPGYWGLDTGDWGLGNR